MGYGTVLKLSTALFIMIATGQAANHRPYAWVFFLHVWVGQPFAIVMFSRGICVRSIDYVYYKYIMYLSLEVMV